MMDEIEYIKLCNELDENGDLDDNDRLHFYVLHQTVSKPNSEVLNELFHHLLKLKKADYTYHLSEKERIQLLILLDNKRNDIGLSRSENEYLNFLKWKYDEIESPKIPEIISIIPKDFKERFVLNNHRDLLFKYLIDSLNICCLDYKIDSLNVIIGGSFCDVENQNPNDIDLILLLPQGIFQKDWQHTISNKVIRDFKIDGKKNIDLLKLPENYDLDHFMSYELLTLLGNNDLDRKTENIKDKKYISRHVYQFRHSLT